MLLDGRYQAERFRKRLDQAFGRYALVGGDAEVQADFARYLSVLVSGYIEQTVYILFLEFTRKRSDKRVLRHVESSLEWFQNPKAEKIANLLGSFDASWQGEFEEFVDGERKDAMNSVVALRNAVAHGEQTGTTHRQLRELLPRVYDVIDWLVVRLTG